MSYLVLPFYESSACSQSWLSLLFIAVNTTARIETTGQKNRIHLSEATASILIHSGKGDWVQKRRDLVDAKGKGALSTYWLVVTGVRSMGTSDDGKEASESTTTEVEKKLRLINWMVDAMTRLLKQVVARRAMTISSSNPDLMAKLEGNGRAGTVLEEVQDVISLPKFDSKARDFYSSAEESCELPSKVVAELRDYITLVASAYSSNVSCLIVLVNVGVPYDGVHEISFVA